jgi:hypothetical protein
MYNAKPIFNLSRIMTKNNLTPNQNIFNWNTGQNNNQNENQGKSPNNLSNATPNKFPYLTQNPYKKFTPLDQSYESALKEIIVENLITLPNTWGFEPKVKSTWWNEAHYCKSHQCKGRLTRSCMQLKHKIQDLIDQNII